MYFNSNMVRLRVISYRNILLNQIHFNSNMVRLRDILHIRYIFSKKNFNSNMVRLREDEVKKEFLQNEFQFQYGAIKRIAIACHDYDFELFQFQYGAIKSTIPVLFYIYMC